MIQKPPKKLYTLLDAITFQQMLAKNMAPVCK